MLDESDVRSSMLSPSKNSVIQYGLSVWTGKALSNQQPLFKSNAATQFASTISFVIFGVAGSYFVIVYLPWYLIFLLLATWLLTVSGARKFQTDVHHQISHYRFSGNELVDRVVSDAFTPVFLTQDYLSYKREHQKHHTNALATINDPDARFLYNWGIRPGMSKNELWNQFLKTLVSPRFHFDFLYYRIVANFWDAPPHRILLSFVWLTILALVVASYGFVTVFAVWIFPMVVLYQIASILQFTTEHHWFVLRDKNDTAKEHLVKLTVGRFFGEVYPQSGKLVDKAVWAFRMVFYHGVARLLVCPGTLPAHDAHHRHVGTTEWSNFIFFRQHDIDTGCKGWDEYQEIWGFYNMLDGAFEHISKMPAILENTEFKAEPVKETVLGM